MKHESTYPAITDALAEIRSRDWLRQHAGIQELAGIPSAESDLALLRLLDHRSSNVRLAALEALVERDHVVARLAARAMLSDPDPHSLARDTAAEAVGRLGTRLDRRRLTAALTDDEAWAVRASAADSLGQVAQRAAIPALIRAMRDDPHPVVRRYAAVAIASVGDASVLPEMEAALAAESEDKARLGLLSGMYILGQEERLAPFLALLGSDDDTVRHATVNALEVDTRDKDRPVVIDVLRSLVDVEANPGVRGDALRVIASLRGEPSVDSP